MRRYDPRTEYRPAFVRVLTVVLAVLAVFVAWGLVGDGVVGVLRGGPWVVLFLVVLPYALFWSPSVRVNADQVMVVNPFTSVVVPFARLARVETRFALALACDDGFSVRVWCAPAGSGRQSMRWASPARSVELMRALGDTANRTVAASAVPGSDSGNAAILVSRAWERWRADAVGVDRDGDTAVGQPVVRRMVRWPVVGACTGLVLASLLTLIW